MEEMEEKSSKPEISVRWQYRRTLNHDFNFKKKREKDKEIETNSINTEKQTKRKKENKYKQKPHEKRLVKTIVWISGFE